MNEQKADIFASARVREQIFNTYSSPEGRAVLRGLITRSGFLLSTIVNKPDAQTYTREASKNIIYWLLETVPALVGEEIARICIEWENGINQKFIEELNHGSDFGES
jgi:hypothetical protein